MNHINVMTACDEGYAKYIFPQLVSLSKVNTNHKINFFLLYTRVSNETINKLVEFSETLGLKFYPCLVDKNIDEYTLLASSAGGGGTGQKYFPYEVYFPLDCHNYLPNWVDRVLYIHAADVIFVEDFSEYYFSDFNDKAITVEITARNFIKQVEDGKPHFYSTEEHLEFLNKNSLLQYFNSGTFMINVDKFRKKQRTLDFYLDMRKLIIENRPKILNGKYYDGDQAFFSFAFLGDVNSFRGVSDNEINMRVYNYSPFVKQLRYAFKRTEQLEHRIIHFDGRFKPWSIEPDFFEKGNIPGNVNETNFLKRLHSFTPAAFKEYYTLYWKLVEETPIFNEMIKDSKLLSSNIKRTYLVAVSSDIRHIEKNLELTQELNDVKRVLRKILDELTNMELN
ncbi:glycosyltransferase family 8 protein [Lactococcus petauri]|uniref:glycosyltransferase family 8 protein n=1 Tax=Lactococcus petauri TaxID=1940789 RepID=UPI00254B15B5|nr:glycosyltransferase [Lactococcus petauri]MDT2552353.1 glycosyltransferase [Lactococcus petauri]MDT2562863.1 glycosyltransferase [Lactococcus petauri]MDT2581713.1 glycosyltransferase [Lactococcus petauri]